MAQAGKLYVTVGAKISGFTKAMERVQQKLQATSEKMKDTGETLTKNLTTPMVGVGGIAVKAATDWGAAQAQIQASTGKTAKEAQELTDIARKLWKKGFGEDAMQVADTVALIDRNIQGLSKNDLSTLSEQALVLEKTFGVGVEESVRTASVMMKNFGISGSEAMDLMTVGFQKGGDMAGDLLDTLHEYAPQFSKMGIDAKTALNILISGAQEGAFNMDKMGDALKEFSIRAVDGSETTAEGFEMIGLNAEEMASQIAQGGESAEKAFQATLVALASIEDPLKREQAGVALFGTMWEDLGAKAVLSMTDMEDKLGDVEGAAQKAGEAHRKSLGNQLREQWRKLLLAMQPLGVHLLELANVVFPMLANAVSKVSSWFTNLSPTMQKVVVGIGLLVAAIGPLLVVMGTVIGAVANVIKAMNKVPTSLKSVSKGIKGLGTALRFLATNPIGLAITAIAGLVTIGIYLWKNWDSIKPKIIAVWNTVKNGIGKAWDWLTSKAQWLWGKVKGIWNGLKNSVLNIASNLRNKAVETWNNLTSRVKKTAQSLRDGVVSRFNSLKNKASSIFNKAKNVIVKPIEKAKDKIRKTIDKIKSFFDFKISFPKIKMPKLPRFKLSGKFSLNPPSVPKLSVDWFAKGGIVDGASIIGVGEAGPEAIIPLSGNAMNPFAEAIASKLSQFMGNAGGSQEIIVPVIIDGKEVARVTAPYMDRELGRKRNQKSRAKGGI